MAKRPKYRVYKVTLKVKSDYSLYGSNWRLAEEPRYFMSLTDAREYMKSEARQSTTLNDYSCGVPKGSAAKGEYTWTDPGNRGRSSVKHYKMELFELTGTAAKRFFIKHVKGGFQGASGFYFWKDVKKIPKDIQEKYKK